MNFQFNPRALITGADPNPQFERFPGTNFPIPGLNYNAGIEQAAFFDFKAFEYAAVGDVTVTIEWYPEKATTGDVVWEAALAAASVGDNIATKAFATATRATSSVSGTKGIQTATITITGAALDSLAAEDDVTVRVRRATDDVSDTMSGDAILRRVAVDYPT